MINFNQTLASFQRIVGENPDKVYVNPRGHNISSSDGDGQCYYVHDSTTDGHEGDPVCGCIIGKYLVEELGVPMDVLSRHNTDTVDMLEDQLEDLGYPHSESARRFMFRLQRHQDLGKTWGEALRLAADGVS